MAKKRKNRSRRRASTPRRPRHARLPAPRVPAPPLPPPPNRPDESANPAAVRELVNLQTEVCRASGKPPFTVWADWLTTLAPWLAAVGQTGDLTAALTLPEAVLDLYANLSERYLSPRFPAALRVMQENFTRMWHILNLNTPRFTAESPAVWEANPDLVGQAFFTGLGRPRRWAPFFPTWDQARAAARNLIPNPEAAGGQIYTALALAHFRAQLRRGRALDRPAPGSDPEGWQTWLATVLPHADLPRLCPQVTSVTLLPALAARWSPWLVRGAALVHFAWPALAADPLLDSINTVNAALMGLNGFYLSRQAANLQAVERLEQILDELEQTPPPDDPAPLPHPADVYAARPAPPLLPPDPELPSFSTLARRRGGRR